MEDTEQNTETETPELKETEKLPSIKQRIKQCLDDMLNGGIDYGSFYSNAFFERRLFMDRNQSGFSICVHMIRVELEKEGFYLNGRGQEKKGFIILMPNWHADLSKQRGKGIKRTVERDVTLMFKTPVERLNDREKQLHEKQLRNTVVQHLSMERSKGVEKMIRSKFPNLEFPEVLEVA